MHRDGSKQMRTTLEAAAARQQGLRRVHNEQPGRPPWPAHPATLTALVRRGLLARTELLNRNGYRVDVWQITDAGREALEPVEIIKSPRPIYLARPGGTRYRLLPSGRWALADDGGLTSGDYSTDPTRSIDSDNCTGTRRSVAVEVIVTQADIAAFTKRARQRELARRRKAAKNLDNTSTEARLVGIGQAARENRVDISSDERLIRHLLANDRERAALAKLVSVETRLRQRAA